jgi:hypothetical protein
MGTLSGQTIQDTYDGLLKLEDSTNQITSTLQNLQDGLGNNTGIRIAQNQLFHRQLTFADNFKPDYGGTGIGSSSTAYVAGNENKLKAELFYDAGLYTYSSITYNLVTATSTGDVVNVAFYDAQFVDGVGLAPKDLIMSGITLTSTGSTGFIETVLPSNLSFTGGSQFYFMCVIRSNSGVTPTVVYRAPTDFPDGNVNTTAITGDAALLGMALWEVTTGSGTYYCRPGGRAASQNHSPYNTLGFQTSYSSSDILSNATATQSNLRNIGYILKTI